MNIKDMTLEDLDVAGIEKLLQQGPMDEAEIASALTEWREMVTKAVVVQMVLQGTIAMAWNGSALQFSLCEGGA